MNYSENENERLKHQVKSQQEALAHWRRQADLDYVQTQRMYWALVSAKDYIEANGGDPVRLQNINEALEGVRLVPPKVFA